jgi:hypothetical protein
MIFFTFSHTVDLMKKVNNPSLSAQGICMFKTTLFLSFFLTPFFTSATGLSPSQKPQEIKPTPLSADSLVFTYEERVVAQDCETAASVINAMNSRYRNDLIKAECKDQRLRVEVFGAAPHGQTKFGRILNDFSCEKIMTLSEDVSNLTSEGASLVTDVYCGNPGSRTFYIVINTAE